MGKPAKIIHTSSLELIFEEFIYTRARLKADKHTALLAEFETFLPKFWDILQKEFGFRAIIVEAFSNIFSRDIDLNEVSDIGIKAILALCTKGYKDVLYQHYCDEKRPHEFRRPILGRQLERVRAWISSMRNPNSHPSLQALADLVEATVLAGDDAIAQRDKAREESSAFREFGERKLFIDWFNDLREKTYDGLEEIRKNTTDRALPEEYSEGYFRRSRARNSTEGRADIASLEQEIADLKSQLAERETRLAQLKTEEEARERHEAELEAALAAAEEAERLAEESRKRAQELRARLKKK